jgi:hypothetical protein
MNIKANLIKLHWLLSSQFGIDPRVFLRSLRGLPVYLRDWANFRKGYTGPMKFMPCLYDRYEEGGTTKSEYFWQDLLVARAIHAAKPVKHVVRLSEIEVFNVLPISTIVPEVVFHQADLLNESFFPKTKGADNCDSLSCLHTIQHFGIVRYGDPVIPQVYRRGIANMAQITTCMRN